jgi:glyoxylase-like metal-dependent hydrolase (beta-lactamase superfamily II)
MKNICAGLIAFASLQATAAGGNLEMKWDPGADECTTSDQKHLQVHHVDSTTVVLRQGLCIAYEANLLYLLVGKTRSLLIDTGAVEDPPTATLTVNAVEEILRMTGAAPTLLVVHTHGHQDHRAGDAAFAALPGVRIAPVETEPLRAFFGFRDWPNDLVQIALGDRIVDVIPTPGHHEDHVVFYDRNTRLLITGDFLLPGRLLVQDIDAYRTSARRVAEFAGKNPIDHALGAHIEMDAKGNLFASGATYHPDERALRLSAEDVTALPAALEDFNGFYSRHENYVVVNSMHNLMVVASVVILALGLLAAWARGLW